MSLGVEMDAWRKSLRLTLEDAAAQMDVSRTAVIQWGRGSEPAHHRHVVRQWLDLAQQLAANPDLDEVSAPRVDRRDGTLMTVRRGTKRRRSAPAVVESSPVARAIPSPPTATAAGPDVLSELREIRVLLARLVEINSRAEKSRYSDLTAPRNAGQDNPVMNAQPIDVPGPRKRGKPPLPGGWTPYKVGLTKATFAELGETAQRLGVKQADLARRVMELGLRALQEEEDSEART